MNEELRVLVRDHTNYKRWETRYRNALKLKADGEEQKRPTEYNVTAEYKERMEGLLVQSGDWTEGLEKQIRKIVHALPIWKEWAKAVPGIGELSIGYLEAFVDLDKATDNQGRVVISKVWRFCGYGDPDDKGKKGQKRNYVESLKTQLYTLGMSIEKTRNICESKYGAIYDGVKERYANSERVTSEKQKNGIHSVVAWKDARPGHRRNAAIRRTVKEILKDYVIVRSALEGRAVRPPYSEEYLGKRHSA